MIRAIFVGVSAIGFLTSALPAQADDDYARSGCYLGVSGIYAEGFDLQESGGFGARAGCRGEWLAGELHYEWLDGFDDSSASFSQGEPGWGLSGNVKLYMLPGRIQPFATLGIGYLEFDGDWDYAGRMGGGIDYYLTNNVALDFDVTYVLPASNGSLSRAEYLSIGWGVIHRF